MTTDQLYLIISGCALALGLWFNIRLFKKLVSIIPPTIKYSVGIWLRVAKGLLWFILAYSILIVVAANTMMFYLDMQSLNEYKMYILTGLVILVMSLASTLTWRLLRWTRKWRLTVSIQLKIRESDPAG